MSCLVFFLEVLENLPKYQTFNLMERRILLSHLPSDKPCMLKLFYFCHLSFAKVIEQERNMFTFFDVNAMLRGSAFIEILFLSSMM